MRLLTLPFFCSFFLLMPFLAFAQPTVNLGADTSHCGAYLLDANNVGASFLWSTGETTQTILAANSGITWVEVSDLTGTARDSINLSISPLPVLTQTMPNGSYCKGNINLITQSSLGATAWYTDDNTLLGGGDTLLYNLDTAVTLYYEASALIPVWNGTVGLPKDFNVVGQARYTPNQNNRGLGFDALQNFYLKSVWMAVDASFSATVILKNASGQTIYSTPINLTRGVHKVDLNYQIPTGTGYQLLLSNMSGGNPFCVYPIPNGWNSYNYPFLNMTAGVGGGNPNMYRFFFHWEAFFNNGNTCSSPRDSITLGILPTPIVQLGADTAVCGNNLLLDASNTGGGFTYLWSDGSTNPTLNAQNTGSYAVTVSSGGICNTIDSIALQLNPLPVLTQTMPNGSYCKGNINLITQSSLGATAWYTDNNALLGGGDTLLYNLDTAVTLYYEASALIPVWNGTVGLPKDFNVVGQARYTPNQNNRGLGFDALQDFYLKSVWMAVDASFSATVILKDANGQTIYSTPINLTRGIHKVDLNYQIPTGTGYQLLLSNMSGGNPFCVYPVPNGWNSYNYPFLNMTAGVGTGNSNMYRFFFHWEAFFNIGNTCSSPRDSITLGVLPTPIVQLGADTAICGNNLLLDATNTGGGFTYLWSDGSTNPTLNAQNTGSYVVTVTNNGICNTIDSIYTQIDPLPMLTQQSPDSSYCRGTVHLRTASSIGTAAWYTDDNTLLGGGYDFVYNLDTAVTLYYEASALVPAWTGVVGLPKDFNVVGQARYTPNQNNRGLGFDALQDFYLKSVWMAVDASFSATVILKDANGQTIYSTPINLTRGIHKVDLNYQIPTGTGYQLLLSNMSGGNPFCVYPVPNGWNSYNYPFLNMTAGVGGGNSNMYRFFFHWEAFFNTGNTCSSPRDSATLGVLPTPVVQLGADTSICGDTLVLDATNSGNGYSYLWSDFSHSPTLSIHQNGSYSVTVTKAFCKSSDQINVNFFRAAQLQQLSPDSSYCKGLVSLTAQADSGTVFWLDNQKQRLQITDTLIYNLQNPTTLYYQASSLVTTNTVVGLDQIKNGQYLNNQNGKGIRFDVFQDLQLTSVLISTFNAPFSATVQLRDANNQLIYSTPIQLNTIGDARIILDYTIPVGSNYTLSLRNIVGSRLYGQNAFYGWSSLTYPFMNLKGGTTAGSYSIFYDWKVLLRPDGECYSAIDSVVLDTLLTPRYVLPSDTLVCTNNMILDATSLNASYLWNTNNTAATQLVSQEGSYTVTATIGSCSIVDSTQVYLNPSPNISLLSADTTTCVAWIERRVGGNADIYRWYNDAHYNQLIGKGATLNYQALQTDTLWVEGTNFANKIYPQGLRDTFVSNSTSYIFPNQIRGLKFDAHEYLRIKEVTIYLGSITNPFIGTIQLWDANDNPIDSVVGLFANNLGKNVLTLNLDVPAGQNYKLVLSDYSVTPLLREVPFILFPLVGDYLTIKGGVASANAYDFFYDWKVQLLNCPSARLPSIVQVLPTPSIDLPSDTIVCGDSVRLDRTWVNATSFLWNNGQTTGSILLDSSQTVSLVATLGSCSDQDSSRIILVEPPTLVIPPNDTTICEGVITLFAQGNAPYYAWYNSASSSNPLALGDSLSRNFQDTTTLWVEGVGFLPKSGTAALSKGDFANTERFGSPQNSLYPTRGILFRVNSPIRLDEVSIYIEDTLSATLTILKTGIPIYTQNLQLNQIGRNRIALSVLLEQGNYSIELSHIVGGKILINSPFNNFGQLNQNEISFISGKPIASQYVYFYDWKIATPSCATNRLSFRVNVPESPLISLVADTATCSLSSMVLTAVNSPQSSYNYLWSTGDTSDSLLVNSSGYYGLTVTNNGQCSSSKDILVQFLSQPNPSIIADTTICSPDSIRLGNIVSDGILLWYNNANRMEVAAISSPYSTYISDTTRLWTVVAPKATTRLGLYSQHNSNNPNAYQNFIMANTFDLHQNALLDSVAVYLATAPTTIEIVLMDSNGITLNRASHTIRQAQQKAFVPLGFNIPKGQGYRLSLSQLPTAILVNQNAIARPSSSAAIATLTGTVFAGVDYATFFDWHFSYAYPSCQTPLDSNLIAVSIPIALVDSAYTCDTLQLSMYHPNIQNYSWSTGQTSRQITVGNAGLYTVTVSDGQGCTAVSQTQVSKAKDVFSTASAQSCDNILNNNYTANQASFVWNTGATTASITINHTGYYSVTATTNLGCVLNDSVYVSQIIPAPLPNLPNNLRSCFFDTLDAGFAGQNMAYLWNNGATTQKIEVRNDSFYTVTVTHPLGCFGSDYSLVRIDTIPAAAFSFSRINSTAVGMNNITTGLNNNTSFVWDMGDGTTYTTPHPFHSYDSLDCYNVSLAVNDPCGVDTAFLENILGIPDSLCDDTVGIFRLENNRLSIGFKIVPNPASSHFALQLEQPLSEETIFRLIDINGRIVEEKILPFSNQTTWDIYPSNLSTGVYFVLLKNHKQRKIQRVVIMKSF